MLCIYFHFCLLNLSKDSFLHFSFFTFKCIWCKKTAIIEPKNHFFPFHLLISFFLVQWKVRRTVRSFIVGAELRFCLPLFLLFLNKTVWKSSFVRKRKSCLCRLCHQLMIYYIFSDSICFPPPSRFFQKSLRQRESE